MAANNLVKLSLSIEEIFASLLGNYYEFEESLLAISLGRLVYANGTWDSLQEDIHVVGRRLSNFLSSARHYLDYLDHVLPEEHGLRSAARTARSDEYDTRLGYRVLEALRNYGQHRGHSVHHLSIELSRDEDVESGTGARVKHSITPSISLADLRRDGGFKSEILRELEGLGSDRLDVKPLVRGYLEGLSGVHVAVRTAMATPLQTAEAELSTAFESIPANPGEDIIGIEFVTIDDGQGATTTEVALRDTGTRRALLERRRRASGFFASHYVSSETTSRSDPAR